MYLTGVRKINLYKIVNGKLEAYVDYRSRKHQETQESARERYWPAR